MFHQQARFAYLLAAPASAWLMFALFAHANDPASPDRAPNATRSPYHV